MKVGMLWYDDTQASLPEKVVKAAAFYKEKYGHAPTTCIVNPNMLEGDSPETVGNIEIRSGRGALPYHLWIGTGRTTH